jgi:hypothetical protein
VVYAREQHRIIMQAVQTVEPRSGALLIQHHGLDGQGGMSLADIGRARGLSRERVRQIVARQRQLRGHPLLQALAAEDVRTPKSCTGGQDKHVAETRRPSAPGRAHHISSVIS